MKQRQAFKYTLFAGWFITALAIVIVAPLIVIEENRSHYFWYYVIWTEVLCLLFWGSASFYILVSAAQKDSVSRFGGITPAVSIITAAYAILSFFVMVMHAFMSGSDAASRIHWILQIVLFAVAALSIVFLAIARAAATTGLGFDMAKAMKPKELHDLVALHESSLKCPSTYGLKSSMKQLREALMYSLNESTSLAELSDYQELCREIQTLCDSVAGLPSVNDASADQLNSLSHFANTLTTRTKLIANKQVRR